MIDRRDSTSPPRADALAQCLHAARAVGAEPELALAGGGNTSVKVDTPGGTVLWVKGSGADLGQVREADYVALPLAPVRALAAEKDLANPRMRAALASLRLAPAGPAPSIETLMHAVLPARHVIHTHAAPVLALSNTAGASAHLAAALDARVRTVPYRHSGTALAAACAAAIEGLDHRVVGLVLEHHGLVTWGDDARAAYAATLDLCKAADGYLDRHGATRPAPASLADEPLAPATSCLIEDLRDAAAALAGRPLVAAIRNTAFLRDFAARADVVPLTAAGPSTPGHTLLVRRLPQIGRDCAGFSTAYRDWLGPVASLDSAPRIILDPEFGLLALGSDARRAAAAAAIFVGDAITMTRAAALDTYRTVDPAWLRLAEAEYGGAPADEVLAAERLAHAAGVPEALPA